MFMNGETLTSSYSEFIKKIKLNETEVESSKSHSFLPRDAMQSAVMPHVRPSVRPSVCPLVGFSV